MFPLSYQDHEVQWFDVFQLDMLLLLYVHCREFKKIKLHASQ